MCIWQKDKYRKGKTMRKTILVTGAAGFIGANLICELLKSQESVNIIGIDNIINAI